MSNISPTKGLPTSNNGVNSKKRSVDVLLQRRGKLLNVGESCRVRMYKGSDKCTTNDPVDPKAPSTEFPAIAKFPISAVQIPSFAKHPWNTARLYQQDIPKPAAGDDSDEDNNNEQQNTTKKRWRYNRKENAGNKPRQWVLQEQVDFLETMVARREKKQHNNNSQQHQSNHPDGSTNDANSNSRGAVRNAISSRYEGIPEHSTSHFAIVRMDRRTNQLVAQMVPTMATITFQQPAARRTLTLSQAEQVLEDQRSGFRNAMIWDRTDHEKIKQQQATGVVVDAVQTKKPLLGGPGFGGGGRILGASRTKSIKERLLSKLKEKEKDDDIDEADDVMGDVAFRNRRGGGAARRELLTSLGDGLAVSDDGVIGGTNDAAFGGKQRFGKLQIDNPATSTGGGGEDGGGDDGAGSGAGAFEDANNKTERGADGAAMEEDFYTRDVGAEYEELDYDANEQFDDDDVDLGEAEVQVEGAGYGPEDDEEDDDETDEEEPDETIGGAEGLASVAGFKALLAKARGEIAAQPTEAGNGGDETSTGDSKNVTNSDKNNATTTSDQIRRQKQRAKQEEEANDHFSKIVAAAEKASEKANKKKQQLPTESSSFINNDAANTVGSNKAEASAMIPKTMGEAVKEAGAGIQVDENGLRIISLQAVQKEIWLNHGSITTKRLMKLFDVKKKSSEQRQNLFRDIVKELCTMKTDPIKGRMLVLKQHYSNMG